MVALQVIADALLFFPEVDLGTGPVPWGLTPMLARDVGLAKAKELVMLCGAHCRMGGCCDLCMCAG